MDSTPIVVQSTAPVPVDLQACMPVWKHYSTWVATAFAIIVAAPVDWANFDFTKLTMNDVLRSAVFIVIFVASKKAKQGPEVVVTDKR